jgi:hypothetical protein
LDIIQIVDIKGSSQLIAMPFFEKGETVMSGYWKVAERMLSQFKGRNRYQEEVVWKMKN